MTFDFLTTAAPASQPAPPPGAAALAAAADSGIADAFDAALAETLAVIDRQASRQTTGGAIEPPMPAEWMFPVLSAAIAEASAGDVEDRAAVAAPDDDIPEVTSGDAPTAVTAVPVDVAGLVVSAVPVVPMTATASIADAETAAAVPMRPEVPAKTIAFAPATATRVHAAEAGGPEGSPQQTEPGGAVAAPIGPVPASVPSSAGTATSSAAAAPVRAVTAAAGVPAVAVQASLAVQVPAGSAAPAAVADAAEQAAEPPVSAGRSGGPVMTAAAAESRRAAMRYMAGVAQQMNPSDAAAAAPTASAPPSVVDVAAAAGVPVPVAIPAAVSRAADTAPTATPPSAAAIEIEADAQPDTPMSGEEDPSQGQGRPSPEFVRFAAALSQTGSIDRDEIGRNAAPLGSAPATQAAPAAATATTVVAPPTAPATMTPGEENVGRLVQAMRVNARPGAWEATVRLNPEHLGDVTIALRVERNSVTAVVNAEGAGVRQWLESQEQAVRSGMAEHGLQLERFVVQRDGQRRDPQEPEGQPRKRQPKRDAQGAERFEIHV